MDLELLNILISEVKHKNYVFSEKYNYCPSIYDKNNNIRAIQKSKFKKIFLEYIGNDYYINDIKYIQNCYIYDASMIIYKIPLNFTYEQALRFLGKTYIEPLLKKDIKELHLVFDNSKYVTLAKSLTQKNRNTENNYFKNKEERDIFINNFINWIKDNYKYKNKRIIVSGLNNVDTSLLILNCKYRNNKIFTSKQGEADQGVIFHSYMTIWKEITINSADTDLLFLILLHYDLYLLKNKNIKLVIDKNKIIDIKKLIDITKSKFVNIKNIIPTIVILYILSGCDYLPCFYYISKEHVFKTLVKYKNNEILKNGLCIFELNNIDLNIDLCLNFISLCYYDKYKKYFKKDNDLFLQSKFNQDCIKYIYNTLKDNCIDIQKNIPDMKTLNNHILKCKYVINLWVQSYKRKPKYHDILEYGWSYDIDKNILLY